MNRSHESLIRLARFKVEGLQKQMAELDRARGSLGRKADELAKDVEREQDAAAADPAGGAAYGAYARAVIQRRENLKASIAEVDAQAEALRAELRAAYEELKKYELLEERRVARDREARQSAERAELDEAGARRMAG